MQLTVNQCFRKVDVGSIPTLGAFGLACQVFDTKMRTNNGSLADWRTHRIATPNNGEFDSHMALQVN